MEIYRDTHVSFGLAKLLKEKEFPQELGEFGSINAVPYYTQNGGLVSRDLGTIRQSCYPEAAAPTNQSVLKYIRERMGFIITVTPRMLSTGTRAKVKRVMGYKSVIMMPNEPYKVVVGEYDKWEQAEEAGIEYILENFTKPKQDEGI